MTDLRMEDQVTLDDCQDEQDPNADLIGFEFNVMLCRWIVVGTSPECGPLYVTVAVKDDPEVKSVRPAGIVRRHKQLVEGRAV